MAFGAIVEWPGACSRSPAACLAALWLPPPSAAERRRVSPMRAALLCCSASGHHPAYEYAGEYEPLAAERPVSAV